MRKDAVTNMRTSEEEERRRAVKAMRAKNWTLVEIAEALELPEKEIEKYL